jgi:DNA-binding CsgD family transcriptional regulator
MRLAVDRARTAEARGTSGSLSVVRIKLEGKPLSRPELDVLRAAAEGLSARETADRLIKSEHTVMAQRRAIEAKLGARNLSHAIALAFRRRVL